MLLTKLRKNQHDAVKKALEHDGLAFFGEMRTGKSLASLAVADARKPDILFVVSNKKGTRVWCEQFREHLKIDWSCQRIFVHYESLCRNAEDRRWYRYRFRHAWVGKTIMLIVDEGHRIKRRGSMQSRMIRSLGKLADWRLLLSGTPGHKARRDAWAIFDFIMPGVFEDELEDFEEMYLEMGGYKDREVVGHKNNERFERIFHTYSHRITLREAQVEAGKKPYRVVRKRIVVELEEESRRAYDELERDLKTEINKRKIKTPLVLTLVGKLQQIAGGFVIHTEQRYHEDGTPILKSNGKPLVDREIVRVGREKLKALEQLVTMNEDFAEKFVICALYTHEIDAISRSLTRLGRTWKIISGKTQFDGTFDCDCIIMNEKSAESFDLGHATTFCFFSWAHSYIAYDQSRFRVLRFDTQLIREYYIVAKDTVDEEILAAIREHQSVARHLWDTARHRQGRFSRHSTRVSRAIAPA